MTTIGGKQFINRGTSQNPIYQRAGSSASIVSGGTAIDGANVSTGTDAPASAADGDLWFNETVGSLFVYIDGTGWVESNPGGGTDGGAEWVAINQTSTTNHLVGSSSNISSITDIDTGISKINFQNAYSSATSYGVGVVSDEASSSSVYIIILNAATDSFELHNRVADSYRDAADLRAVISG